jgi:heme-degrading monooxygenase HmoA
MNGRSARPAAARPTGTLDGVITYSKASLSVISETHAAADVTAVLGLEPTTTAEIGDRKSLSGLPRKYSLWVLDAPSERGDSDPLESLADLLRGKAPALETLRENYTTEIVYGGFSDSSQGSFVFSANLMAELGALGCDFLGTAYLDEPDYDTPSVREQVVLPVIAGREDEFEAAFGKAERIVAASPGFRDLTLSRGIETPNHYLLLVEWDSLEAHETGFRGSPAYDEWSALLHEFYEPFPEVRHYTELTRLRG